MTAYERARARMVEHLATRSGARPAVLEAFGRVRREHFAPRFRTAPPGAPPMRGPDAPEWLVADPDDEVVAGLVYEPSRPLAIQLDDSLAGGLSSTVSAPDLLVHMLDVLDLAPGMRVLEVGAGSGYTAALLAEVVGPEGQVTTIDIDDELVAAAAARLAEAGYLHVDVVAGDGHQGAPDGAPYDRIVATVGCADLSSAWLRQLAPDGAVLVPLRHGGSHPLLLAQRTDVGAEGTVVGRSGFVEVQGAQAGTAPWTVPSPVRPGAGDLTVAPLEPPLGEALGDVGSDAYGGLRTWDLAYRIALEDGRASFGASLQDVDGSTALIDAADRSVAWAGLQGRALRDRLLEIARGWLADGAPGAAAHRSTFVPVGAAVPAAARWVVRRHEHQQAVSLGEDG